MLFFEYEEALQKEQMRKDHSIMLSSFGRVKI